MVCLRLLLGALAVTCACGGTVGGGADAALDDAPRADAALDAPALAPPPPCPTSGAGAILATGASCFAFTPVATGASASGANATVPHYALAPAGGGTGHLVLFLNPSLGTPAHAIADPATNIYTAAIAAGDHVLALAYPSDQVIGVTCKTDAACFLPTRLTIVTGVYQPGAAQSLATIGVTDGIYGRAALALRYLAAADPAGGWAQYFDPAADIATQPEAAVRWDKVIVMGHSQGGGHAALIAKLHAVARLVTLSSPCDAVGASPVAWQTYDATWASTPAAIGYGFATLTTFGSSGAATGGDTTCPAHAAIWDAMGMVSAHRFEDAAQCAGASAHTATTQCTANMPRVQQLVTF